MVVQVYGHQGELDGNPPAHSQYSIDGGVPSNYTIPDGLQGQQYSILFYSSPILPYGNHTLNITSLIADSWYYIDFMTVDIGDVNFANRTAFSSPTSLPSGPDGASGTQSMAQPSKTDFLSIGTIVGIAIGSAVFGSILTFWMLWCTRRLRNTLAYPRASSKMVQNPQDIQFNAMRGSAMHATRDPQTIEPFIPPVSLQQRFKRTLKEHMSTSRISERFHNPYGREVKLTSRLYRTRGAAYWYMTQVYEQHHTGIRLL
ncbi:hypothetical protein M422DRAFT_52163 [Sphaerobolus stellatus SS14]|uniref:Uncharacterized protein n=1 Tax=Sphaerobolus stellatus (strain SS14) TaxID=990650 RepID=A0A0C9TUL8_SPHS4|nr:hypothetical protein M422DRAFT_52163 [Sphaerobolus stellatus SS14]